MERLALSKLGLTSADPEGRDQSVHITASIYDSFRSYRRDRCAILTDDPESLQSLLQESGLNLEFLDPEANFHWQGVQTNTTRRWKRIIIGDYLDWFHWYMRWQRFNAFHTIVLVRPISRMADDAYRGYIDGFLTRLLGKPSLHKAIIVEEPSLGPVVEQWLGDASSISDPHLAGYFGKDEIGAAILGTLYGARLSHTDLALAVSRTLSAKINQDWRSILQKTETNSWLISRHNNFRTLGEDGMKMVQSLSNVSAKLKEEEPKYEELFQLSRKRDHIRGDNGWIQEQVLRLVEARGWFTIPPTVQPYAN